MSGALVENCASAHMSAEHSVIEMEEQPTLSTRYGGLLRAPDLAQKKARPAKDWVKVSTDGHSAPLRSFWACAFYPQWAKSPSIAAWVFDRLLLPKTTMYAQKEQQDAIGGWRR